MVRCSVLDCKSDGEQKFPGLSFHSFPTKQTWREIWISATGRNGWEPKKSSKICSKHFENAFLIKKLTKTYLDYDAVPTKFIKLADRNPLPSISSKSAYSSSTNVKKCITKTVPLEKDMENYIKFKLVGGRLRLKKGVVPHNFECQKPQKTNIDIPGFKKTQTIEYLDGVLSKDIGHEDLLLHSIEVVESENQESNIIQENDPLKLPEEIDVIQRNNEEGQKTQAVQELKMEPVEEDIKTQPLSYTPNFNFEASNVEACRICLATDVKMYRLRDTNLGRCMESITGLDNSLEGLPDYVCYECAAYLMKCNKLIEKSRTAQATLQDIFNKNGQITKTLIEENNNVILNLQSSLDNSDPINVHIDSISDLNTSNCIKTETDLEEPLDHTIKNEIKEELCNEDIDISEDLNAGNTISDVTITEGVNQMGQTEGKADKYRNKMVKNMKLFTFVEEPKETYMHKHFDVKVIPVQNANTKKYLCKFCPKSFNNIDGANEHRVAGCSVSQSGNTSSIASSSTELKYSYSQVESTTLQNMKRINTGMAEELPLDSPLETPHAKRLRTLDYQGLDGYHSGSKLTAAPLVIKLEPYDQTSTSTANVLPVPSSSSAY